MKLTEGRTSVDTMIVRTSGGFLDRTRRDHAKLVLESVTTDWNAKNIRSAELTPPRALPVASSEPRARFAVDANGFWHRLQPQSTGEERVA
jgi:hypothetical protein